MKLFMNEAKVIKIFKELKKAIKLDLKNLKKTEFIDEELYTVSRNKKLKKSLLRYGKDLLSFAKNPIDFCNIDLIWSATNSELHDIVLHDEKLYFVYEDDKNDIASLFDEKSDDYLNTDAASNPIEYNNYFDDEEEDTISELTFTYFKNAENVMGKYFF